MKTTQNKGYKMVAKLNADLIEARKRGDEVAADEIEKALAKLAE